MEQPFDELPEMPKDFAGKLQLLREQMGIFIRTARQTIVGPLAGNESPEMHMLCKAMDDLEEVAPEAMDAFAETHQMHMRIAEKALKEAEEFPEKLKALDEQLAKDLAPYAAENFIPRPQEPVPKFLDVLDMERDTAEVEALLLEEVPASRNSQVPPVPSGNIWENWNPQAQPKGGKDRDSRKELEYLFTAKMLKQLGLDPEPEKQLPSGGNIWEGWK